MTLLQEELEEWQTGKKKSEQIAQLQEEIAAMETGMTEVSNPLLETIATVSKFFSKRNYIFSYLKVLAFILYFYMYVELITVQNGVDGKRSLTREETRPSEVNATRGD